MLKILAIVAVVVAVMAVVAWAGPSCGECGSKNSGTTPAKAGQVADYDPVCKMKMDRSVQPAGGKSVYNGVTYLFCNKNCKTAFDKDPQKYITKKQTK